ncbi:MAG: hypothetical protein QMD04_11000 [Anaerolineales bacterium]|nr:hypothetical protein [Anaerolineales bacterium]
MKTFPGLEQMQAHVPEMRTRRGSLLIGLYVLGSFALVALFFVLLDSRWPGGTLVTQFVVLGVGFFWLARFITRRAAFKQRWGELAYRNAFAIHGVPGLALILSAVIHVAYMPGPAIVAQPPNDYMFLLYLRDGQPVGQAFWRSGEPTYGYGAPILLLGDPSLQVMVQPPGN